MPQHQDKRKKVPMKRDTLGARMPNFKGVGDATPPDILAQLLQVHKSNREQSLSDDKRLTNVIQRGQETAKLESSIADVQTKRAKAREAESKATLSEFFTKQQVPLEYPQDREVAGFPIQPQGPNPPSPITRPVTGDNALADAVSTRLRQPDDPQLGRLFNQFTDLLGQQKQPVAQDPRRDALKKDFIESLYERVSVMNARRARRLAHRERINLTIDEQIKGEAEGKKSRFSPKVLNQQQRGITADLDRILQQRILIQEVFKSLDDEGLAKDSKKMAHLQKAVSLLSRFRDEERAQAGEGRAQTREERAEKGFLQLIQQQLGEASRSERRIKISEEGLKLDREKFGSSIIERIEKLRSADRKEQLQAKKFAVDFEGNRQRIARSFGQDGSEGAAQKLIVGTKAGGDSQNFYQDFYDLEQKSLEDKKERKKAAPVGPQQRSKVSKELDKAMKEWMISDDSGNVVPLTSIYIPFFPIAGKLFDAYNNRKANAKKKLERLEEGVTQIEANQNDRMFPSEPDDRKPSVIEADANIIKQQVLNISEEVNRAMIDRARRINKAIQK